MSTPKMFDRRGADFFLAADAFFDEGYAREAGPVPSLVYLYLCRRANKKDQAWPGQERIAADLGISKRSVVDAIKTLERIGCLGVERCAIGATKRGNVYFLPALPTHSDGEENRHDTPESNSAKSAPLPGNSAKSAPLPGNSAKSAPSIVQNLHLEVNTVEVTPETNVSGAGNDQKPKAPTLELTKPDKPGGQRPLHDLVDTWIELMGGQEPARYAKCLGVAKQLAAAGVTPGELRELFAYVNGWAPLPDLFMLVRHLDRFRATKRQQASQPATKPLRSGAAPMVFRTDNLPIAPKGSNLAAPRSEAN